METLLKKVQTVEEKAQALAIDAQSQGQAQLVKFGQQKAHILLTIRRRAEEEAAGIIQERVEAAHREIDALANDRRQAVEASHRAAKKNRATAMEYLRRAMQTLYGL